MECAREYIAFFSLIGIIVLRGRGEVPREAHRLSVTQDGNVLWKNSRNCWKLVRVLHATMRPERVIVNA